MHARLHGAAGGRRLGVPRWPALPPAALLAGGAAVAALVSLLLPSSPSYDPYAWLVWGRELSDPAQPFGLAGGPSWKPLPVLLAGPLWLAAGTAAPAAWLVVARAGGLLALAGGWALAARLAGRWAALPAVLGLVLLDGIVSLALRGASEPLLLACALWAIERHLAGRLGQAFALALAAALIRPEAFPFAVLYAAWRWRGADARERRLLAGGLLLVPALWLGPPAATGDPLAASRYATDYRGNTGADPGWTALRRGLGLTTAPVWVLAGAAVALRPRDAAVRVVALGAMAWVALVVAMTVVGYPGLARFMLPAAAVACVLAAVAAVELMRRCASRAPPALAAAALAALAAALVGFGVRPAGTLEGQVREATRLARMQRQLTTAVAAAGGPRALLACGVVATNAVAQTALAWKLDVPLDRVSQRVRSGGIALAGPRSPELGPAPPVTIPAAQRRLVARAGVWRVEAVASAAAPLPRGCRLVHGHDASPAPAIRR
jgi:hypothetical protein